MQYKRGHEETMQNLDIWEWLFDLKQFPQIYFSLQTHKQIVERLTNMNLAMFHFGDEYSEIKRGFEIANRNRDIENEVIEPFEFEATI